MKKFIISSLMLMMTVLSSLVAGTFDFDKVSYKNIMAFSMSEVRTKYSQEYIEEEFYKEKIPAEYADAFLYYTRNYKNKSEFRKNFYSIMVHESDGFTAFVHKNKDGSIDKGPSQLNSNNIKNPNFRKYYNPKDESHITSVYCFYMVMTINFYHDLVSKYGEEYAFFAYNGGERVVDLIKENIKDSRKESLLSQVKNYDKCVRRKLAKTNSEIEKFANHFKVAKAIEMASKLMSSFDNLHMFPALKLTKNIQKPVKKNLFYVRKEDPVYFEFEEVGIIYNPAIGRFDVQST